MHFSSSHFLCILFGIHFTIPYAKPNSFYRGFLDEFTSQYRERKENYGFSHEIILEKKYVKTNSYFNAFQKNPFYDHFQSFSTLKL